MTRLDGKFIKGLSLEDLVRQRGHILLSKSHLLAANSGTIFETITMRLDGPQTGIIGEHFYNWFNQKNNRADLSKSIKDNNRYILELGTSKFELDGLQENHYTKTLEWYFSELLMRVFGVINSGFSVLLKDSPDGGDYDTLAFTPGEIIVVECKSGNPANVGLNAFENFFKRIDFVSATIPIFFIDTKKLEKSDQFERIKDDMSKAIGGLEIHHIKSRDSSISFLMSDYMPFYLCWCSSTGDETPEQALRAILKFHYGLERQLRIGFSTDLNIIHPDLFEVLE